jgi:hypothetical protein
LRVNMGLNSYSGNENYQCFDHIENGECGGNAAGKPVAMQPHAEKIHTPPGEEDDIVAKPVLCSYPLQKCKPRDSNALSIL